ncbi:hypothetical protein [Reyranella sp.]|jgi:hypothetical protein|uniref:hypothetical protein n=1 Tax=Reyranella sp. TaxID=1929291 RepID=UPI003784476F
MDTIQSIIQALLTGLDDLHAGVCGAATAALGRASAISPPRPLPSLSPLPCAWSTR